MRKQHPSDSGNKEDQAGDGEAVGAKSPTDSGDFCGFVTNYTDDKVTPTYVAVPNNESLCPNICQLASIEQISSTTVLGAQTKPEGGWVLNVDGDMQSGDLSFDALILASHNPSLAANTIDSIIQAERMASDASPADDAHSQLLERLDNLVSDLYQTRDAKQPVFSWSGRFPTELTQSLEFDAASVPGSHVVQFVARESSKPQYLNDVGGETTEIWTAISTSVLAQDILQRHSGREASEEAATIMSQAVSQLLFPNEANATPQDASAVRWGAAFTSPTLGLKEDSIFLNPWRLTIAGDFISDTHPSPLEAAALSGLEAGERVAAMFQAMGSIPSQQ
mmetsp:Transcript_34014/g.82474  ORF Transcript_34014/g.82474 Transcript_34014/m.82474 type:complete len:336 (-) Transcript_34014:16-1023(-)